MKVAAALLCAAQVATAAASDPAASGGIGGLVDALRSFVTTGDAVRDETRPPGFVVTGCVHGATPGLTAAPSPCVAYTSGSRVTETASITYPDASTCWVVAHGAGTGDVASNVPFTRVAGTHYLLNCTSPTQPDLPPDGIALMKVVTARGAIATVADLRPRPSFGWPLYDCQRDGGAVPDDGLDDAPALQRLVDRVPTGSHVYCGPGRWTIAGTQGLRFRRPVTLTGERPYPLESGTAIQGGTLFDCTRNTAGNCLSFTLPERVGVCSAGTCSAGRRGDACTTDAACNVVGGHYTVRDFAVRGARQSGGTRGHCLYLEADDSAGFMPMYLVLDGVGVYDCNDRGVYFRGNFENPTVKDLFVDHVNGAGVWVERMGEGGPLLEKGGVGTLSGGMNQSVWINTRIYHAGMGARLADAERVGLRFAPFSYSPAVFLGLTVSYGRGDGAVFGAAGPIVLEGFQAESVDGSVTPPALPGRTSLWIGPRAYGGVPLGPLRGLLLDGGTFWAQRFARNSIVVDAAARDVELRGFQINQRVAAPARDIQVASGAKNVRIHDWYRQDDDGRECLGFDDDDFSGSGAGSCNGQCTGPDEPFDDAASNGCAGPGTGRLCCTVVVDDSAGQSRWRKDGSTAEGSTPSIGIGTRLEPATLRGPTQVGVRVAPLGSPSATAVVGVEAQARRSGAGITTDMIGVRAQAPVATAGGCRNAVQFQADDNAAACSAAAIGFLQKGTAPTNVLEGKLRLGASGSDVKAHFSGATSIDLPSIGGGAIATTRIAVAGALPTDVAYCSPQGAPEASLVWSAYAADAAVMVRVHNTSGEAVDPAVRTWTCDVWRH